jgi:hypothetical protein
LSRVAVKQHERERQVEQVVKKHPECLDSYRNLLIWYWHDVDGALKYDPATATFSLATWNISRLSSPEAITRALRRLIEAKVVAIRAETERGRRLNEEDMRNFHLAEKNIIPRVMKSG